MAQNYKRRISLFPDSFSKFHNSLKRINEKDLIEQADMETFNKKIINKETPKKEKKIKLSLLQTPSIEKNKLRKISIYSPISFGDIPTPITNYDLNHRKRELQLESLSSQKNITKFNTKLFQEDDAEFNDIINSKISLFPCEKIKKVIYSNKSNVNSNKKIIFTDDKNKKFSFSLYNDKDIYEKNDIINKCNNFCNINKTEDNSDDEEIQSKYNSCIFELSKAFNYINNNPNFFKDKINKRKKCL